MTNRNAVAPDSTIVITHEFTIRVYSTSVEQAHIVPSLRKFSDAGAKRLRVIDEKPT